MSAFHNLLVTLFFLFGFTNTAQRAGLGSGRPYRLSLYPCWLQVFFCIGGSEYGKKEVYVRDVFAIVTLMLTKNNLHDFTSWLNMKNKHLNFYLSTCDQNLLG
jgi:hypothetical protein